MTDPLASMTSKSTYSNGQYVCVVLIFNTSSNVGSCKQSLEGKIPMRLMFEMIEVIIFGVVVIVRVL